MRQRAGLLSSAGVVWRVAAGGDASNLIARASASEPRANSGGRFGLPRSACPIELDEGGWACPPPRGAMRERPFYAKVRKPMPRKPPKVERPKTAYRRKPKHPKREVE